MSWFRAMKYRDTLLNMKSRDADVARVTARTQDLTRDLGAMVRLGTSLEAVDKLLTEALDALGSVIPFDLATVMELSGGELVVRVAAGPLDGPDVRRHRLSLANFPSILELLDSGHARAFVEHDHKDGDGDPFDGLLDLPHGHACMVVPLRAEDVRLGVITVDRQVCGAYPDEVVELADVFGRLLALAMCFGEQSQRLERLSEQLSEQNRALRQKVLGSRAQGENIEVLPSAAMQHIARLARQVAPADTPVLLTGETGTGKGMLAHAIHELLGGGPFVEVNCSAMPAALVEAELFGHERGTFTDAKTSRPGLFEAAGGGAVFLDEIGELEPAIQAKFLKVIEEKRARRLGAIRDRALDVQVIAATNRDLDADVVAGRFRADLLHRLRVLTFEIPPLRARPGDIVLLARHFCEQLGSQYRRGSCRLAPDAETALRAYPWPGNVRELHNVLERAVLLGAGDLLHAGDLPGLAGSAASSGAAPGEPSAAFDAHDPNTPFTLPEGGIELETVERELLRQALERAEGNRTRAAALLGLSRHTLRYRMEKFGFE